MNPTAVVLMLIALAGTTLSVQEADQERIDRLIEDLGASGRDARVKAADELRKLGDGAVVALRKAANDEDAERALLAREILIWLRTPAGERDGKGIEPVPMTSVVYHDWIRGVYFRMGPDGKVELKAPELPREKDGKREFKTWRADSLAEFKEQHPELTQQYKLESIAGPALVKKEVLEWWRTTWDWLGLTEAERREGKSAKREPREGDRAAFGVLAGPLGPALASQLGLKKGEGALLVEVTPDSVADNAGLKAYDVLVKVDGRPIEETTRVRELLRDALRKDTFAVEVIREGKKETIQVRSSR